MAIFNRRNESRLPNDKELKMMLNKLVSEAKKEFNEIENFLKIIYENNYRADYKFLNMTLEKFSDYLETRKNELANKLATEIGFQKINLLFKEYKDIEQMKKFIDNYIIFAQKKSEEDKFFLAINPSKTTLNKFINILESRQKYLNELFRK